MRYKNEEACVDRVIALIGQMRANREEEGACRIFL